MPWIWGQFWTFDCLHWRSRTWSFNFKYKKEEKLTATCSYSPFAALRWAYATWSAISLICHLASLKYIIYSIYSYLVHISFIQFHSFTPIWFIFGVFTSYLGSFGLLHHISFTLEAQLIILNLHFRSSLQGLLSCPLLASFGFFSHL